MKSQRTTSPKRRKKKATTPAVQPVSVFYHTRWKGIITVHFPVYPDVHEPFRDMVRIKALYPDRVVMEKRLVYSMISAAVWTQGRIKKPHSAN